MSETHDDEVMTDSDSKADVLLLSEDERRVLELYDRLQQLQLEIAIMKVSRQNLPRVHDSPETLIAAQNELLESRANYKLRNDAVDLVMMANPILKAVHSGSNASPIERDLLRHVERRDEASIAVAKDSAAIRHTRRDLTAVQTETIQVCRQNIELTASLFDLAEELKNKKQVNIDDIQAQREIRELEDRLRASRRKWRVIKGVASAVVAGSGVDWARDETLREIVLDPENED